MFRPTSSRIAFTARTSFYQLWRKSLLPPFVALRPITARQELLLHSSTKSPVSQAQVSIPNISTEEANFAENPKLAPKEPQEDTDSDYNFVVAASWHPKTRARKSRTTAEKIPYWKRTQVGKVDAGEDAFFHTSTRKGLALGVADGVGGWAEVGVDPGKLTYSYFKRLTPCVATYVFIKQLHIYSIILMDAHEQLCEHCQRLGVGKCT
jgi:hypothetical protein